MNSQKITEIRLELPVGTIAGKWWGPMNVRPILCLHGWEDNAGTFDELIPLLPITVSYFAIDFPGHGLSSKIKNGLTYDMTSFIHLVKVIKKHYSWDKISIMGHSVGAIIGTLFAGFFPEEIDFFINIDGIILDVFNPKKFIKQQREFLEYSLVADERNYRNVESPSYSYEQLLERLQNLIHKSLDIKGAKILLKRGSKQSEKINDQFIVSRDGRLRMLNNWIISNEMWATILNNITVPLCYIQPGNALGYREDYEFAISVLKDKPNFFHNFVKGRHHVHLTHPERVSDIISNFIKKNVGVKSKL